MAQWSRNISDSDAVSKILSVEANTGFIGYAVDKAKLSSSDSLILSKFI